MTLVQILVLVILLFAVYLGWTLSRGRAGRVRLYLVAGAILLSLYGAALAQLFDGSAGLVEALNVIALGLSLGALPAGPWLWQEQIERDLHRTRLSAPVTSHDLLTWNAWLKFVDRRGANVAASGYLLLFTVAVIATAATLLARGTVVDRAFALAPLAAPATFAVLSTIWVRRAARNLVPDA